MYHCPNCHKPIYDALTEHDTTTNVQLDAYCQCPRITIYLSDYCYEVMKSLLGQLQPAKTAVPQVFYDALGDEEVSL